MIFTYLMLLVQSEEGIAPSDRYLPVRVVHFEGKPIISATLNGNPAHFLIDTGASVSILNIRDRRELEFRTTLSSPQAGLYGLTGGSKPVEMALQTDLGIQDLTLPFQWAATDLTELARIIERRTDVEINGIIGSDLMHFYGFVIDYSTKTIWIANPAAESEDRAPMITRRN